MFDFEIARYLYRAAFLYEKIFDNTHKSRAYFKAALAVDGYSTDIEQLYRANKLRSLPSIGVSIEKSIGTIIENGYLPLIHTLLGDLPHSIFDLSEHANINDKLLKKLIGHKIFNFEQIANIVKMRASYLTPAEIEILSVAHKNYTQRRFQYAQVYELANELIQILKEMCVVRAISMSGDLYFYQETIEIGDIVCILTSDFNDFLDHIKSISSFKFISSNENVVILKRYDIPFKITVLHEKEYSDKIQIMKAEEIKYRLPHNEETVSQFYGDLHLHTDWSDGLHSIEQMCEMALKLGYSYIAITDHSLSLKPSGMSELDTLTQIKEIQNFNKSSSIPVLAGIEVEILPDGSLDLPDCILKEFDIVIASVHTHFSQPTFLLMDRISRALSNKYVNILAHPTGKLLGRPGKPTVGRKGLDINHDFLLTLCRDNNVALEVNCFPERFDLSLNNLKRAVTIGAKISIGTDAHSIYHMSCAKYALQMLKFVNIPETAVLNCLPLDKLRETLDAKRGSEVKISKDISAEKIKNFNYYFSHNDGILSGGFKSVGIDLTGSETKASGFAVLSGIAVDTVSVFTTEEMIARISKINPAIVSIDSPLSLPVGRCCGSKNCECSKHGIMRYCELTLKRFGIGVYPCLIDSMVNLTMRGIDLATTLRRLGFDVIESYPGVAQDLLHIPRKRKGLELLVQGLKNFGIRGIRDGISHDEADAITSALVGYFYLGDKYVDMGNEKENYLIVPKLETNLSGKGITIGLVGHIAAGKTTVAEYLRFKHGFSSMRFSKIIEEKYGVSGRDNLQRMGLEIASNPMKQKELSDIMIRNMKAGENYAVDGIRQFMDYDNLAETLGDKFILLSIETPFHLRADRYCKFDHTVTNEGFAKIDAMSVESTIDKISYKCDYRIKNDKSYKELMKKLDSLVKELSN